MNVASRMESTGSPGRIHLSQDAAQMLKAAGKEDWLVEREDVVSVKGKGAMNTYWLKFCPMNDDAKLVNPEQESNDGDLDGSIRIEEYDAPNKNVARLIDWNTEVLLDLLRKVVARRRAVDRRHGKRHAQDYTRDTSLVEYKKYVAQRSLVDHVAEVINISDFEKELDVECPNKIRLGPEVEAQARAYVTECAALYNNVAFHNFEHASRKWPRLIVHFPNPTRFLRFRFLCTLKQTYRCCHVRQQSSWSDHHPRERWIPAAGSE